MAGGEKGLHPTQVPFTGIAKIKGGGGGALLPHKYKTRNANRQQGRGRREFRSKVEGGEQ